MNLPRRRVRAAWIVALLADAIQIVLLPFTGTLSTWGDKPLDVAVMLVLWRLIGWHWVLLPTFLIELFPYVDIAPTWTLAVWLATRGARSTGDSIATDVAGAKLPSKPS
jgi:hypothetical protein